MTAMSGEISLDGVELGRWRDDRPRARAARIQAEAGIYNWSCLAAEQAAQLAVKALLHELGRGPRGHDLVHPVEDLRECVTDQDPRPIHSSPPS
jgi:HEPN domain-containing protein